jgi:hypothetical protein
MSEVPVETASDPMRIPTNSALSISFFIKDVVRTVIKITVEAIVSLFDDDYHLLLRDYFGIDLYISEVPPIVDCFNHLPLAYEGPTFITSHSCRGMHSKTRFVRGNRTLLLNAAVGGR